MRVLAFRFHNDNSPEGLPPTESRFASTNIDIELVLWNPTDVNSQQQVTQVGTRSKDKDAHND